MPKKRITLIASITFLLALSALNPVFAEEKKASGWDKFKKALIAPLERVFNATLRNPDQYQKDMMSDDPQESLKATEEWEEARKKIPEEAVNLGEEAVEELGGPLGKIKDAIEFFKRLFKDEEEDTSKDSNSPEEDKPLEAPKLDSDRLREMWSDSEEEVEDAPPPLWYVQPD